MPILSGILCLLLFSFAKVVLTKCGGKPYHFPYGRHSGCGMCRVCPKHVLENANTYRRNHDSFCNSFPLLTTGQNVSCVNLDYPKPSCPKLTVLVGFLNCTDSHYLESECTLSCPSNCEASTDIRLKCIAKILLDGSAYIFWNHDRPHCVGKRPDNTSTINSTQIECKTVFHQDNGSENVILSSKDGHPDEDKMVLPHDNGQGHTQPAWFGNAISGAIVGGVCIVVVVVITACVKRYGRCKGGDFISVHLQNSMGQINWHTWKVRAGSTIEVEVTTVNSSVQSLVLWKNSEAYYSGDFARPNHVVIETVQAEHNGSFTWEVLLEDGRQKEGKITLIVEGEKDHGIPSKSPTSVVDVEDNSTVVTAFIQTGASSTSVGSSTTSSDSPSTRSASSSSDSLEDQLPDENTPLTSDISGGASCNETQSDALVNIDPSCQGTEEPKEMLLRLPYKTILNLCAILDRQEEEGMLTWHVLARELLHKDEDFITSTEYHLRGKMEKGPTRCVFTLLTQERVTIEKFYEFLNKQPRSQTQERVINLLERDMLSKQSQT